MKKPKDAGTKYKAMKFPKDSHRNQKKRTHTLSHRKG